MDAITYIKAKDTLTNHCSINCSLCYLCDEKNGTGLQCKDFESSYPEQAVMIVEQWTKERPKNTRQSEFLKLYPNALIRHGNLVLCPHSIDEKYECSQWDDCNVCKLAYWLSPIDDADKL